MRSTKANIAGLTSSLQQVEMKSILAGVWPPLKPLPVFKYETAEYRATIAFDKKLGEWVCRKTSLPSNAVQELRGGLREITLALPHDEGEAFSADPEQQEQEVEKDLNRRLQALHDWRESYESGALYFELRDYLAETQRTEVDDSLRLSLTARQLQFSAKNVAYVFDALSTAGGRFATLIEFAKRKKAKQGTELQEQGREAPPEAERAIDHDQQRQWNGSGEFEGPLDNRIARDHGAAEGCTDSDELPAMSIRNILPEQEQTFPAERIALHRAAQQFESETSEIVDADSASMVEHPYREGQHPPAFTGFSAQVQAGETFAEHGGSSSPRFAALEISALQVAAFAALLLCAVFAFTAGLTVGRRPLAGRIQEAPKSIVAMEAKSTKLLDPTEESPSRVPIPAATSANESGGNRKAGEATPTERESEGNTRRPEDFGKTRSTAADSSEPTLSSNGDFGLARGGEIMPGSPAPRKVIPGISATPGSPRSSAILVTLPGRGSQAFRVSFREKTIAATSSLAMSSQLSVLVSAEPGFRVAHAPARLEAGDLVSYVWPRYPRSVDRNGSAETIRVRATIGQLGQVREVKFLSGSNSLLPATRAAIRQWRYRPTLLDKKPVQAQQDVTIEFRPPQS